MNARLLPAVWAGIFGGALGTFLAAALTLTPVLSLATTVLFAIAAFMAVDDWIAFRVRDSLNLALLLAGLATVAADRGVGPMMQQAILIGLRDAAICGGLFLIVREGYFRVSGHDGLGLGDVKFAAACGPWVGWSGFSHVVLLASLAALAFALLRQVIAGESQIGQRLPFASFLAPALAFVWIAFAGQSSGFIAVFRPAFGP